MIIQVLRVFRQAPLYFCLYTLDLVGSSHKRVSESAQNPTKNTRFEVRAREIDITFVNKLDIL